MTTDALPPPTRTLILGGVRSGKSRLAERLARESGLAVTYVATATPSDDEMAARIAAHRARRPAHWQLVEEPLRLAATLERACAPERCVLVECLTLWLANLIWQPDPAVMDRELAALDELLPRLPGQLIFVGNEVNMGVIAIDALTRRYCDRAGELHQRLGAICDRVVLTVAGLPLVVKGAAL
jgi:adenosylcobinamide kinase/adenosylcobinamide-phosphate guanylyltransferase